MNKTKRKERSEYRAMETAVQALQSIEIHEKICVDRWSEMTVELRQLHEVNIAYSTKLERLGWIVIGVIIIASIACLVGVYL